MLKKWNKDVRSSGKKRGKRIGLKPFASPAPGSWWILCNPTNLFDEREYRVIIVDENYRTYARMGHQGGMVVFHSAKYDNHELRNLGKWSMPKEDFDHLYRELKGDELDDERAMILLANVG